VIESTRTSSFLLRRDGSFWRRLASFGAEHAPEAVVRYSPPAWALLFALALPDARARVRANLRRIVGPRPAHREWLDVVRTFSHFASCLTEALAMAGPRADRVACAVDGAGHLEEALAVGRGVILVTAHTGGWETVGPMLRRRFDLDMMVAMLREPDARARSIQDRARALSGIKVVHIGREPLSVLPLFTHLRHGGALGLQIDRVPDGMRGLPVQLFGAPAEIPAGPFHLARATGAPIVPVFMRRLGYFRYGVRLCPVIDVRRGATERELVQAAERAAHAMERFISDHPTDWFDFRNGSSSAPGTEAEKVP
jgi:KDO2-lipid IV(A) lauroyltransferase